jgi:proteasome lid subunit RPN8/RPN11
VSVCGTDAAAHTATGVIKIKVAKPGGTISQVAADAGVVTGGAPSFVYSLADGDGVGVTLTSRACELMAKHCAESNRHGREVGGILVGYSFEVEPGAATRNIHTVMTDIIPVKPSDSSGAHLSLSEQDWLHVQHLFDAKYTTQGKVRVGWYHTHPTQKVFFSNMDADTHTVFRQPHQFALVVDPRKMEAGLFYWKDYERLLLAGPLLFMLEEQADVTAGASAPSGVGSAPLSTPRLALFILVATAGWAALFWKATSGLPLTLNDMNLTALGLLAGLRLWNGGFFRPRRASTRKGQSGVEEVRAGWGEYAPRGRRWLKERSSKALATFLLGVLMLGGLILYLQDRRDTPVTRVTQQQTANKAEAVPSNDAAQQRTTLVIMLSDGIRDGKATRTLTSLGTPGAQVTYVAGNPMDGHEIWNVVGGLDEEREFLKSVFKLGLSDGKNDTNDKKVFQSALGITNGDGDWGPTTRETFVRKAAELRESGEPLMFRLGQAEVRAKFVDGGSRRTTTGRH